LFLPLSVIYLTRIVGLSPVHVGVGLTIAGSVAVAAVPLCGALLDRFDARTILLSCFAASALAFVAYIWVDSFATFVAVALPVQIAGRMQGPARAVLALGVITTRDRSIGLAWQQTVRNFGYGLGGLLAAASLLGDTRVVFDCVLAANAASYLVAGVLVLRLPPVRPIGGDAGASGFLTVLRDRQYVALALLNTVIALHDSVLQIAMPLWLVTRTSAPLALTGVLFTLNTLLVVVLQVRATRRVAVAGGIGQSYRDAAISFVVACGAFSFAAGKPTLAAVALLVLGLAALTRAEIENGASEWFLSVELAPAALRGRYLGVFKSSMALQQAVGPALVTALLTGWGAFGWMALALILAGGAVASRTLGARAIRRSHEELEKSARLAA
jgi:hypothetical protein